jgi:hypothetical protein
VFSITPIPHISNLQFSKSSCLLHGAAVGSAVEQNPGLPRVVKIEVSLAKDPSKPV